MVGKWIGVDRAISGCIGEAENGYEKVSREEEAGRYDNMCPRRREQMRSRSEHALILAFF